MMLELELDVNSIEDSPLKNGGVTFLSFLVFGFIPLLSFLIFDGFDIGPGGQRDAAIVFTAVTLFSLGAIKAYYCNATKTQIFKSGISVLLNGIIAAAAAFFISLWTS